MIGCAGMRRAFDRVPAVAPSPGGRGQPTRASALAAMLVAALPACLATPARAEVVSRTMQVDVEFAERYGSGERVKTASDARLQLYAETAEECRRLEAMSGLACRVDNLTLRTEVQPGRAALLGSVRFALRPRGDGDAGTPR